jgi:hypothetical protein
MDLFHTLLQLITSLINALSVYKSQSWLWMPGFHTGHNCALLTTPLLLLPRSFRVAQSFLHFAHDSLESDSPTHNCLEFQVTLQLTVSQPVLFGVESLLGFMTRFKKPPRPAFLHRANRPQVLNSSRQFEAGCHCPAAFGKFLESARAWWRNSEAGRSF